MQNLLLCKVKVQTIGLFEDGPQLIKFYTNVYLRLFTVLKIKKVKFINIAYQLKLY